MILTKFICMQEIAIDVSEPKYEFLIKKREDAGIKHLIDSKAFIGYSNTMNDVWENWWVQLKQNKNLNCVWWYGCIHYDN